MDGKTIADTLKGYIAHEKTRQAIADEIDAALAQARVEEREACAKVCEELHVKCANCGGQNPHDVCDHAEPWDYAAAIRARRA